LLVTAKRLGLNALALRVFDSPIASVFLTGWAWTFSCAGRLLITDFFSTDIFASLSYFLASQTKTALADSGGDKECDLASLDNSPTIPKTDGPRRRCALSCW